MPPSMEVHRPDLPTALAFLKQVKEEMPAEYETFLEVLTQFRSQKVDAEMVVTVVAEMLVGRHYLLENFSNFLPPACREILLERYTEDNSLQSPDGKSAKGGTTIVDDGATNSQGKRADEQGESATSPSGTKSKAATTKNKTTRAPNGSRVDRSHEFIADMPVEIKRKREGNLDMDLRPARPHALLNSYAGMGKRMSQQQIWQAQLKKAITPPNMAQVWADLERRMEAHIVDIQRAPDDWIPAIPIDDILNDCVDAAIVARLKLTGVIKIRATLARDHATRLNTEMEQEVRYCLGVEPSNPASYQHIYNPDNPKAFTLGGVQEMYYTRAQFEARENENMLKVRVWLNKIWDYMDPTDKSCLYLPEAELCYVDRWRHRLPGFATQTGMKEHIDNGAMSRWADPAWQSVYHSIMQGNLEEYDSWKVGERVNTKGACTAFRSFQGWLALSAQGPNDGTLEVVPLCRDAMAYVLLRPFQNDVPVHQFCGVNDTGGGDTLEITSRWHSTLLRAKIPIGPVEPGDTVWWHPDVIHSVEAVHEGKLASNVLYIPSTPMCLQNAKYVAQQREAFLKGDAPPGFPNLHLDTSANRHLTADKLSQAGRRTMGIEAYPEAAILGGFWNSDSAAPDGVAKEERAGGGEYSEEEILARKVLFAQCQACLFQETEASVLR